MREDKIMEWMVLVGLELLTLIKDFESEQAGKDCSRKKLE